jgi:hypothetical protein
MVAKLAHDFGSYPSKEGLEAHLEKHGWGKPVGSIFHDESDGLSKMWNGGVWCPIVTSPFGAQAFKGYMLSTQGLPSGVHYAAGFYDAPKDDAQLTQATPVMAYGTANVPYGAHAFAVAGGAGEANGGQVALMISGTSVDSQGERIAGDTEVLVEDIAKLEENEYVESAKRWVGTVSWQLVVQNEGASEYELTLNYGFAQCDSFGGRDVKVEELELSGKAGGMDGGFLVELLKHSGEGWAYSPNAFVPGGDQVLATTEDYSPDNNLGMGKYFGYRREKIGRVIQGSEGEGIILRAKTTVVSAVENLSAHLGFSAV